MRKADQGTTIVVMNAQDKKQEGQIQLDNISSRFKRNFVSVLVSKVFVNSD